MKSIRKWFGQERNRAYLYRVATGAGGVAVFYGALTAEEVVLWAGLVGTAFILPAANTSTKTDA